MKENILLSIDFKSLFLLCLKVAFDDYKTDKMEPWHWATHSEFDI